MRLLCALAVLPVLALAGCHSAYVETTVSNHTAQPMQLIEVDYPSASFGTQTLAPGATFHYRFKVLGEGKMKLIYTDTANQEKKFDGPLLKEGAEGPLTITIADNGVQWQPGPHVLPAN
ncbi:MAG: hypothetical protein PW789_17190 [Edaphobacter sp.]|uniref:hypothetical protein n=1 Tax=Edaphobacter sp. TaxID=1934404 RepID=UPI00239A7C78|nr:hypothetical protein [Edaphobacter sp.]MDE1178312.1 hypothetical protein [Edaphobacter sp.]